MDKDINKTLDELGHREAEELQAEYERQFRGGLTAREQAIVFLAAKAAFDFAKHHYDEILHRGRRDDAGAIEALIAAYLSHWAAENRDMLDKADIPTPPWKLEELISEVQVMLAKIASQSGKQEFWNILAPIGGVQ